MDANHARVLARLAILLLTLCLAVDSALPFHFDASGHSVDAGRRLDQRIAVAPADAARPFEIARIATDPLPLPGRRSAGPAPTAPRFVPLRRHAPTDSTSGPFSDH